MTRPLKYISPFIVYCLGITAFFYNGWICWFSLIYAFVIIPLLELFLRPDPSNLAAAEEELALKNKMYDYLLYVVVLVQYAAIVLFLWQMKYSSYTSADAAGRICTMGLLCGVFGINVGHELGHRTKRFDQFLAKALLLTSLYMHFFIEHNKGHHKNVATPHDPASAKKWEPVYLFYLRTIYFGYINAWKIANTEARRKQHASFSIYNQMLQMHLIQFAFVLIIFLALGWMVTLYYFLAAAIGITLLETVNYIEHYGLQRKQTGNGKYERPLPAHSWNSDHVIGRLMLFELSRHSDHHYLASRKYQVLRHHPNSPQMPTGYPGMMILSLIPPAWFYIMHKQIEKYSTGQEQ